MKVPVGVVVAGMYLVGLVAVSLAFHETRVLALIALVILASVASLTRILWWVAEGITEGRG